MPISISIEPLISSLDMYDSPDTSSAYSLSGHIAITVTPSSSILGLSRSPSQNFILTSLELTFEGQSELILNEVGYAPLRLVSITKQLVAQNKPLHVTVDEDRVEWRVVFDIAVPGWLPATSVFGDDEERAAGVSYALFARARFLSANSDLEDVSVNAVSSSSTSLWNNLCSVVRFGPGRSRSVHADKVPILVTRYVSPPPRSYDDDGASPPTFSRAAYAIQATPNSAPGEGPSTNIPPDVLRSIQLHAIVPSRISIDDGNVSLILRLRCRSEDETMRNQLRVLGFETDIVQSEKYCTSLSSNYTTRFPIPPPEQQPPITALKSPHSVGTLFELGLVAFPPAGKQVEREYSIVPKGASKLFRVRGPDSNELGVPFEDGWLRMEAAVPVIPGLHDSHTNPDGKRVTGETPFMDVQHEMRVRLTVGYEQPNQDILSDEVAFVVPLEFVRLARQAASSFASTFFHMSATSTSSLPLPHPPMDASSRPPSRARSLTSLGSTSVPMSRSTTPALSLSMPASTTPPPLPPLPAYSQLFYENGDRKDEWLSGGGGLPLYREKEDTPADIHSPSSSTSPASVQSAPSSPLTPSTPLTPPGLPCRPKRDHCKRGESFLRFDEDEDEFEPAEAVPGDEADCEDELDDDDGVDLAAAGEVQYGIAF